MAGTIDSLKFDVILEDKEFKRRVNEDIRLAKNLNTSLSNVIKIKNPRDIISSQGVKNAQAMNGYLDQIANKIRNMPKGQFLVGDADRLNATLEQTNKKLDQIIAKSQKAGKNMGGLGGSLNRIWLRFTATIWSVIGMIRIFTRTLGAAIKNISAFQQANANLATIMQVSRKEIEVLTNDALMLGRTTEWTASQVTELQTALAKLGYTIPQIRNMQASVLQFATAVGANLPDAANLAGASLRMFGLHSTEMQRTLEILTASTNKTALDFEKLKVSLPYVGAIAHSIGLDVAETASLLGVLTNAGLESSRAGTGLRQVLLELSKAGGKLQTAMGGNVKTFDDLVKGLEGMRDRGLEAGEATKLVSTRASSALLILANGVDDIKRLNKEVRESEGLLKDIQSERLNTLHGSTLLLKSAWEGLIQTFRDSAGPMKDIVDWLTKIVRATSLAASRANRVAQGTKDVIGSDALTKKYKDRFDSLLGTDDMTPQKAAAIVQDEMQNWLDGAMGDNKHPGIDEKGWYKTLTKSVPLVKWITKAATRKSRAADEQVEAMENTMVAVTDYMTNRAKEDGEIAANEYLDRFQAVFDEKGADAARSAMKSLEQEMKDKGVDVNKLKQRVDAYIANGGEEGATERGKSSESAAEKRRKAAIQDIQTAISLLEKFKTAYDKLEPVLGADAASAWVFENMGHDVSALDDEFEQLIASLRKLGAEGNEAADTVEARLGLDAVNKLLKAKTEAEKAQKALEKYQQTFRQWVSEDFNLGGTGFEYDIRKVFSDYNTKLGGVDEKYIKAVKEAEEAHKGDAEAIAEEIRKLGELRDAEKEYVRAQSQESLNKLAESYLKDQYLLRGISLDHLGDLSIAQLKNLKKELIEVSNEAAKMGVEFSGLDGLLASWGLNIDELTEDDLESLKDKLPESAIEMVRFRKAVKDTGLTIDVLQEKIQSAIKKGLKNLDENEKKSIAKLAKYAAGQVLELANSFREFGEAAGDAKLADAAEGIADIADVAKDAAAGFAQGGWIGAAIGGFVSIFSKLLEYEAAYERSARKLSDARRDIKIMLNESALGEGVDSIFGQNTVRQIENAVKAMDEAADALARYREELSSMLFTSNRMSWFEWLFSGNDGNRPQRVRQNTLEVLAKSLGFDSLYDDDGVFSVDALEAILENYDDLEASEREWINDAIADSKKYKAALEDVKESLQGVLGEIASSAADSIIDGWIAASDAALDYSDILDDVARSYAKMIIKSTIMETALDPITKDLTNAFMNNRYDEAMGMISSAMDSVAASAPIYEQILSAFDPYFKRDSDASGSGLGSGIKSITEDTANLLASYINAMRADLSVIRGLQEKGWESIGLIGTSVPSLNEHLAQVAANTYDTAQATQSVLSELRSVIGAPGTSGMVVRVEAY